MTARKLLAPLHEGTDGCWGGVKDRDAIVLDDFPKPCFIGPVGSTFVHDTSHAIRQGAIDQIRVTGNPPDIGRAPVCVVGLRSKTHLVDKVVPTM